MAVSSEDEARLFVTQFARNITLDTEGKQTAALDAISQLFLMKCVTELT